MESYKININSNKRAIPAAIVFFGLSIYAMTLIPREWPDLVSFGAVAILFFTPVYIVTILSRGKIRIELTEQSFRTNWINRFFLSKEKNIDLPWDRIIDFVYQEDRNLDSFRLTLTNNQQFKFYRYTLFPQKDDFQKFLTQFPRFVKNINESRELSIDRGQTVFETRQFKWLLIAWTLGGIFLLGNSILNPNSGTSWPALGVIFSGLLFYWIQSRGNKN